MVLAELGGKLRESLKRHLTGTKSLGATQLNQLLQDICRALIEADVNVQLVMKLRENIKQKVEKYLPDDDDDDDDDNSSHLKPSARRQQQDLPKLVQRAVVDELTALLQPKHANGKPVVAHQLKRHQPNVVLFVGLQGAGKTTTIAKYAAYHQKRGYRCGMVCADTFRAGALDQLKQNATKLRIPFYGSYTEADPVTIARRGVEQFRNDKLVYELIIVDTSGRHKQEASLLEEMQEIAAVVHPDNVVLVVDATQGQAVYDQAQAFHQSVQVGSVIITKLDGHAKGGGALSAVAATHSPVIFTGTGEHFDDFEPFHAESFVGKLMGFGDLRGLVEAMKGDGKQQEELMEKMSKGQFTLRDMYNQFEKILNMGPMSKFAGMIPGMPDYLVPKNGDQESTNRLRKFCVIMDSMSNKELDGQFDWHGKKDDPVVQSRIRRIAAGSGSHPAEVQMLLLAHRQFAGMVGQMSKSGLLASGGKAGQQQAKLQQAQMAAQLRKNPNLIQQRLNQMDPRVLQQMGGREHVAAMMQQMAKSGGVPPPGGGGMGGMGGMPSMEAMQAMMGGMGGGMPGMGGGGMPGMGGGGAGGMPDMESIMKMASAMGMGGMPGAGR